MDDRVLLTVEEAAKALGLGRSRTYALVASGALPSIKIGRSIRMPLRELESWVQREVDRQTASGQLRPGEPRDWT